MTALLVVDHPEHWPVTIPGAEVISADDYLRLVYEDRWFTKPPGYTLDRTPRGVRLYEGSTSLP